MAHPKMCRRDVDEAQEALRSLVVAVSEVVGVIQRVEAPFDLIAQPVS